MTDIDIHSLPVPQGVNSQTFCRPRFNTISCIPQLYAHHAEKSPQHPLFVYPDEQENIHKIYYPEAYRAIRRAHKIVLGHYKRLEEVYLNRQGLSSTKDDSPVIGILATLDSISYITLALGIMHCGFTPFPISTRNSAIGVAHLVKSTSVCQLFVSDDPAIEHLSREAKAILDREGISTELLVSPRFQDMYNELDNYEDAELVRTARESTILILHSSGSTAQPKPIKFSNSYFIGWGMVPYYGELDVCDTIVATNVLPVFHAMGAVNMIWTVCSGFVVSCFKPSTPPILPTPDAYFKAIVATGSKVVFTVPTFLEIWARSEENIPVLKSAKAVCYAGAPLDYDTGQKLSQAGVKLISCYGATEIGCFTRFISNKLDKEDWQYLEVSPQLKVEMVPHDETKDIFEPVLLACVASTPPVFNITFNNTPAYATGDLLQRHPTKPNLYKIYGRVDDQIILSTGEKTNPAPLEKILLRNPNILYAIYFGRGRFQNGVLIQPKEQFPPEDKDKLANFRNAIWPTIEETNEFAPTHSRLFKEMIVVTDPKKPLQFTTKGTPRRKVCLDAYAKEINELYDSLMEAKQAELAPPESWTEHSVRDFIGRAVRSVVVASDLADDADLFQHGCDSLQASWIRNTIFHALRITSTKISVQDIPLTLVYSHPSIQHLSAYIWNAMLSPTGNVPLNGQAQAMKRNQMEDFVYRYTADLSARSVKGGPFHEGRQTILLTGSTGRFGCHLLARMVEDERVAKVYCLNRDHNGSDSEVEKRQFEALRHWKINLSRDNIAKKAAFIACDLSKDSFGISRDRFHELQHLVTNIIHNAWRVDFNIPLSSFEPLFASTRRLIDLAKKSPIPGGPVFTFVSSISVLQNYHAHEIAEESQVSPSTALGLGYGESKWVAEQLCVAAAYKGGLQRVKIVRVGQISGDRLSGTWNSKEWVGALVRLSEKVSALPVRKEVVSWLPADTAATALIEIALAPQSSVINDTKLNDSALSRTKFFHLLHPHPTTWEAIFEPIAHELKIPLVSYSEWIGRLQKFSAHVEASIQTGTHDASLSLLPFFIQGTLLDESKNSNANGLKGNSITELIGIEMSTARAVAFSPTLASTEPLSAKDAIGWVRYWKEVGLLTSSNKRVYGEESANNTSITGIN